jgi:hypothetical protein
MLVKVSINISPVSKLSIQLSRVGSTVNGIFRQNQSEAFLHQPKQRKHINKGTT